MHFQPAKGGQFSTGADNQLRQAREMVEREGWVVKGEYEDEGFSATSRYKLMLARADLACWCRIAGLTRDRYGPLKTAPRGAD